jgi:hypothetical protein
VVYIARFQNREIGTGIAPDRTIFQNALSWRNLGVREVNLLDIKILKNQSSRYLLVCALPFFFSGFPEKERKSSLFLIFFPWVGTCYHHSVSGKKKNILEASVEKRRIRTVFGAVRKRNGSGTSVSDSFHLIWIWIRIQNFRLNRYRYRSGSGVLMTKK